MGCSTPVEVSAWTTATSFVSPPFSAVSMPAGSMVSPQGASTFTSVPPARSTMSLMRVPKTPLTPTTHRSPGSMRLTRHVSMPAEPVADMGSVSSLSVRITSRSIVWTSSMRSMNHGSRCPMQG